MTTLSARMSATAHDRLPLAPLLALAMATRFLAGVSAGLLWALLAGNAPVVVYAAVAAWGLAFGGVATLFQTALAKTAAEAADVAQSMLVTAWNTAIAGGGIVGGVLLERLGVGAFTPALLALLAATLVVVWAAGRHGFPAPVGAAGSCPATTPDRRTEARP